MIRKKKEKIFKELSWIPKYFSSKVYDLQKLNFTKEDLEQEFNLVLWKAIEYYFSLIKEGRKPKTDIYRYCFIAIQNEKINFIRKINTNKRDLLYISLSNHDVVANQSFDESIEIKMAEEGKLIVDGIDILDFPYDSEYKRIFKDLLIGFTSKEVSEIYQIPDSTIRANICRMKHIIRSNFSDVLANLFKEKTLSIFVDKEEEEMLPVVSESRNMKINKTSNKKSDFYPKVFTNKI